jgi:hypothetical protein
MSSGLYRTFKSNYVPYFPDGNGRDRYIVYNNAGFFKNFPSSPSNKDLSRTGCFFSTKIINKLKSYSVKSPNFHYHADGNGRDKYIIVNGGGLFSETKPLISYKLTDFLRKNEQSASPVKKYKIFMSKDEIRYNKLLKEKEKNLIKRLYTSYKKRFMNRPKINFKSFFSVEDLSKDGKNSFAQSTSIPVFLPKYKKYNDIKEKESSIINNESANYNENILMTPKNKLTYKSLFNFSEKKIFKKKPKIVIDAKILNKKGDMSKESLCQEKFGNTTYKNSSNFYHDFEKLNNYELKKKPSNTRKIKKIFISKSNTGDY